MQRVPRRSGESNRCMQMESLCRSHEEVLQEKLCSILIIPWTLCRWRDPQLADKQGGLDRSCRRIQDLQDKKIVSK